MQGYCGKLLYVDLNTGLTEDRELPESLVRQYLGGSAMAGKLLFDMKAYEADPFGADNPLVVLTGPLTGTPMPGASRCIVAARSPLTGGIGVSACGGFFGARLKFAGYDGVVITGSSPEPSYLYITPSQAKIVSGGTVWGAVTSEVNDLIAEEQGVKKVYSLSIGPAGENKVMYACVMGGEHNAAGRGGLGAVMGAKKLKAIAVHGGSKPQLADRAGFMDHREKMMEVLKEDIALTSYKKYGTAGTMQLGGLVGDVPTKNWRVANWEEGTDKLNGITMADTILSGNKSCFGCPVGCKRVVTIPDGPYRLEKAAGPEYETAVSLGALNMVDDLEAVSAANVLCNDMGMDTISVGSSIAFLTECFEKGLVTEADTLGIPLQWGDADRIIQLLVMIAMRQGVGDLLADGVKRMSERIQRGSYKLAMHCKGMEAPMHDPRAYHGLALAYSTSPRGACHISHYDLVIEMGVQKYPEMGLGGEYEPLSKTGKADMVARSEDLGMVASSAVMCMFVMWPLGVKQHFLPALNLATGMDFTIEQLQQIGERGWFVQRAFNTMCGFTAEDDYLPERMLNPHEEGQHTGLDEIVYSTTKFKPPNVPFVKEISTTMMNKIIPHQKNVFKNMGRFMPMRKLNKAQIEKKQHPDLEHMIREYYTVRMIDREGKPREKKLRAIGLNDVADALFTMKQVTAGEDA